MSAESDKRAYSNGEITVIWQPHLCQHSGNCVRNLGSVFRPKEKPWIQLEHASSQAIIEAVGKCPSGALSIKKEE
ncbi:(4Fe-4S)-binding protein [Flavihumibacter rivuli]|uniref:(4Fe-4S)-binding protein n=1 Tax=Flavihumibacter rivuli TaxID=2838156 RepID=UPI001BDEEB86|nr:(4Fe-4S)-binding protein [Flavihumibacter rivuli]ULQ57761.1 (4Fe-4S)-binding protein [Flavihumibacter rivuli]